MMLNKTILPKNTVSTATVKPVAAGKKAKPVITSEHIKEVTAKLDKQASELESKLNSPAAPVLKAAENALLKSLVRRVNTELKKMDGSFLRVGFAIYQIYVNYLYNELGYQNIYDFTKGEFGLSRGTCQNFITIVNKFGARDSSGNVLDGQLIDIAKGYTSTQLILLASMDSKQIAECNPDMTCADLKRKLSAAKALISKDSKPVSGTDTNLDSDNSVSADIIDSTVKEVHTQPLITCIDLADYESKLDKIDDFIRRTFKNAKHDIQINISYSWVD